MATGSSTDEDRFGIRCKFALTVYYFHTFTDDTPDAHGQKISAVRHDPASAYEGRSNSFATRP